MLNTADSNLRDCAKTIVAETVIPFEYADADMGNALVLAPHMDAFLGN